MKKNYLLTTIVALLTGDEIADKATSNTRHLPAQGAAPQMEGCLACQTSRGLRHDVRVVVVPRVQSHLRVEPTEQEVGAPLGAGWSCPLDLEAGMIQSFSLLISFFY
jgi:hypothetical protein